MPSPEYLDRLVLNQASLPKARQWLAWVTYHFSELPGGHGWESCLRDTLLGLHHLVAVSARRLRGNPTWDFQGTMTDDTERLEEKAILLLRRFDQIDRRDVPIRFEKTLDCLYGALRQQIRLAREIDEMRQRGKIDVDVLVDTKSETAHEQL